ncbi:hypothetical protein EZV62_000488 [Acer yangbiense]|uniref:NET domain-containing protein n=1 Tax=Acer yangbiense TaxID=1000413 RepID=A0A5C7IS47_9ROSI|nr:hypothetical protein EZV62_000488 [Acer yangbiense]
MNVDSVSVFLNKEDGSQLEMFVQESFLLDLKVHPSSISNIGGTLGNFRLCDMTLGTDHCWSWLCDIRNPGIESLIKNVTLVASVDKLNGQSKQVASAITLSSNSDQNHLQRKVTTDEKKKLGAALTRLSPNDLDKALKIVAEYNPNFQPTAQEVDLNMDAQLLSYVPPLKSVTTSRGRIITTVATVVGGVSFILIVIILYLIIRLFKMVVSLQDNEMSSPDLYVYFPPKKGFTFKDPVEVTNNFHESHVIGSKASETVYKAVMDSGLTATVKILASNREDLVEAINNFHKSCVIGSEAFGTVYKVVMDSGLTATVKKLASNREGNTIENIFGQRF